MGKLVPNVGNFKWVGTNRVDMRENTHETTANGDTEDRLTREDVRMMFPENDEPITDVEDMGSKFEKMLTPRTRAAIIDTLVEARGDALSVKQMTEQNPHISTSSFERHRDDLIAYGVMEEAGKVGNAMTYRLRTEHPAAQLLAMLDNILMYGETPQMLDDYFVSEAEMPFEEDVE